MLMHPRDLRPGARVRQKSNDALGTVGPGDGSGRVFVEWDEPDDLGRKTTHADKGHWCRSLELVKAAPTPDPLVIKDTNPKDAVGITKAPMSTLPMPAVQLVALAMMEGALKYGRHNWRRAGIRASVYFDALMRHMNAWWEGEDIDPDSGLPHPVKAAACLLILTDAQLLGMVNDDRPPKAPADWMAKANAHAKALLAKFPNPVAPNTEL